MSFPSLSAGWLRIAAAPVLAILLMIALAGSALANPPPPSPGGPPGDPTANIPAMNPPSGLESPPVNPPGGPTTGPIATDPTATDPTATDPTATDPTATGPTATDPTPTDPTPTAPSSPSGGCLVSHAATPAQLCPIGGGLQYYFIGADGSSHTGPHLAPFSELAALHATGAPVSLYTGANSFTGKPIQIDYLPSEGKIRVSTYYPDTQYDTNKPYVFSVDSGNAVNHESW